MPISALDLVKRSELAQAISQAQADGNWTAIETTVNALINLAALALNDDGTLKDGKVDRAAVVADSILTLAKFAASAEGERGKYVRTNASTGAFEFGGLKSFSAVSNTVAEFTGDQDGAEINTFTIEGVPAGALMIWLKVYAKKNSGTAAGTVSLKLGDTVVDMAATHSLDHGAGETQISLFGRVDAFAGGTLTLPVLFSTDEDTANLTFGVDGDERFGRKLMVLAGL